MYRKSIKINYMTPTFRASAADPSDRDPTAAPLLQRDANPEHKSKRLTGPLVKGRLMGLTRYRSTRSTT